MSNGLYFKTTYSIRPHLLGPIGGLKIERSLYMHVFILHKNTVGGLTVPENVLELIHMCYTLYLPKTI